jgi:coatomer subunit beta
VLLLQKHSNFLRIDLLSANEYVRGSTLRALSKFREMEILESLVAPILSCLEHRYSYVRKNAVLCVHNIYKRFYMLIPDAPERIEKHLETESDTSTSRNAFAMLSDCDPQRAINYLKNLSETGDIPSGDILPLVLVDSARKFAKAGVPEKVCFFSSQSLIWNYVFN